MFGCQPSIVGSAEARLTTNGWQLFVSHPMFSITALAKADVLTSVAPVIKRAKS